MNAKEPRTLPVAVVLKRFFALDLVFILGIECSSCFVCSTRIMGDRNFERKAALGHRYKSLTLPNRTVKLDYLSVQRH